MTECRKVQELTKEFLEKLSKVQAFKERIISLKSNNIYESKRIRTKNSNNNMNDESINNPFQLFSRSDNIKIKKKNVKPIKMPPISNSIIVEKENSKEKEKEKEKERNIKIISQKKLKPLHKPKTSEKSRDKSKYKIKQNNEEKKNDIKLSNDIGQKKSKEETIKKIKIIAKINNDLYERLLNKPKIQNRTRSESPEVRFHSLENMNSNSDVRHSLNVSGKKKKMKKKKLPKLTSLVKEVKYQYCVYLGNYGKLIDILMENRKDKWVKTDIELVKYCDFIWSPLSNVIDFNYCAEKKQFVNHLEYSNSLSNKLNLYYNLLRHCESKKINIFDYFPFSICLSLSQSNFISQIESFKKFCTELPSFTPKSEVKYVEKFNILGSRRTGETQTINIPQTYNTGKNMWIIKPINLNRGRCIQVLNDTNTIVEYLLKIQEMKKIESQDNNNFKCEHIILQKYLEKPLLYQGRKFDIRIWILIIGGQENFVYIFKQGHLKATCAEYDINSSSPFIHLTNYSVQKHNADFSKREIGNEISYKDFQDELDKKKTGKNFLKDIYPKIVYIIRLAVGAAKSNINHLNRINCFEIFGCDFILDEKYKPYLLEININPGLEISPPLISKLVPRMVDDALKLTIDKKYYKDREEPSLYPVDGYDDGENMWEKYSII